MTPREDNGLWHEFSVPRPPFTNNYRIISSSLDGRMDRRPRFEERRRREMFPNNILLPTIDQPIETEIHSNDEIRNNKLVEE